MGSKDAPQLQHTATHAIECSNATLRMCSKDAPQKMQFIGAIKKGASLGTFVQNAKWWKSSTDSVVTEPKQVRIPMILHVTRAYEQGQICIYGLMSKIYHRKKFLRF